MTTFIMLGRYSLEGIKKISAERTVKTQQLAKKFGGALKDIYVTLGEADLVFLVTMPGVEEAMKFSVALSKMLEVSFTTAPAVSAEEFDRMMTEI